MTDFLSEQWRHSFAEACASDKELAAISRSVTFTMLLGAGVRRFVVVFDGALKQIRPEQAINDRWDFSVNAPENIWERFLAPDATRHHHDIMAMWMRVPEFRIDGDRRRFIACLRVVRRLTEIARDVTADPSDRRRKQNQAIYDREQIEGRYLWVEVDNRRYRVYYEQAGTGRPVLLLHTAGADSRQYMHLLNDPAFTDNWRMIAFDLPWHGRSMPPIDWWQEEYRLTTTYYAEVITAFVAALSLKRPIVVGCSMSGAIALELANRFPDVFAGVIALEASHKVPGREIAWTAHPEVNASEAVPSWVDGLVSPTAPEIHRREIWWVYSQSAAGVFNGDLGFFSGEWDGSDRLAEIDTTRCAVRMMTGEFDYSCTVEMSEDTASRIPGAKFVMMRGLGHFPIAEDPERFKEYLLPQLRELMG